MSLDFNTIVQLLDKPDELFVALYKHAHDNKTKAEASMLLAKLNKKHGFAFGQAASEALDAGCSCWTIIDVLRDGFSSLKHHQNDLLPLFEKLYHKTLNDGAAHIQYEYAPSLVKNQPQFAKKLLDLLLKQDSAYICGHVVGLMRARIDGNEASMFGEVLKLRNVPSVHAQYALINVLSGLNYRHPKNKKLVTKAMAALAELEDRKDSQLLPAIAHGYGMMVDAAPTASRKLKEYSGLCLPDVDWQISRVLFHQTKHNKDNWYNDLLMDLGRTKCEHKGIIDNLDFTLFHLLRHNQDWERVGAVLRNWIVNSDFIRTGHKIDELFDSTIATYIQKTDKLQLLITMFLNDDHPAVNKAAGQLISDFRTHGGKSIRLDKDVLSTLDIKDMQFIGRKILGYVFDPEAVMSLALSMLDGKKNTVRVSKLVESVFLPHIFADYPDLCEEFLEKALSVEKSKSKKAFISGVLKQARKVNIQRKRLPHLKELRISSKEKHAIALAEQKMTQAIQDAAQEKSIMAQIATHIPLKYGVGFFSYHDGKFSEPTGLQSFSTSIPIPITEVFAPIDGAKQRFSFRRARRER